MSLWMPEVNPLFVFKHTTAVDYLNNEIIVSSEAKLWAIDS